MTLTLTRIPTRRLRTNHECRAISRQESLLTHFEERDALALIEDQVFIKGGFRGHAVIRAQLILLRVLHVPAENTASF